MQTQLTVTLYVRCLSYSQMEIVMKRSVRFKKFPKCYYAELFQSLHSH
jgi:hypothetical protein